MYQVIGASVIGSSHTRMNLPCQDYFNYRAIQAGKGIIVAVADGLGSAARSADGSRIAVEEVLGAVEAGIREIKPQTEEEWQHVIQQGFAETRDTLIEIAGKQNVELREYGTTLIAVYLHQNLIVIGQIGDGAVVALDDSGNLNTISAPIRGEYANETIPLTAKDALFQTRITVQLKDIKAVAVFTDGLQNLVLSSATMTPYEPAFKPFFDVITGKVDLEDATHKLEEFLASEKVCAKTDDDKTLVLVGKLPEEKRTKQNRVSKYY